MSDDNKVDYNKMTNEELSRLELIRKSKERDKVEGYKKTGKKVVKWYLIVLGAFVLVGLFIMFKILSFFIKSNF